MMKADNLWDFKKNVYVKDGGMGTMIMDLGYNIDDHPLWSGGANIDNPEIVAEAHKKFIEAGADIILTNTYHSSIQVMKEKMGMSQEEAEENIKETAKIALKAVNESSRDVRVIASIGPYATNFRDASEYSGVYVDDPNITEETICQYYTDQMKPLLELEFKNYAFETIPSLEEVRCLIKVLEQTEIDVSGWVSVTCKDTEHLSHGEKFEEYVKLVASSSKIFAIGINCTDPTLISDLLKKGAPNRDGKPFIVYPNRWQEYDGQKFTGEMNANVIIDAIPEWYELGARIFGGCCLVSPEMIQKISERCKELKP